LPHQEYLQLVHWATNFTPPDTNVVLHDIQMPKCGPKQICNIHAIETHLDASANGIRWVIKASLDPNDRFPREFVHLAYSNDVFYQRIVFPQGNTTDRDWSKQRIYPFPIAYPYEKMRWMTRTSSVAAGTTWDVLIFYTIEPIDQKQLTAITLRRGVVKHAREQGPEP